MKTIENAAGQPAGAGTLCANFLRTMLKRAVMWSYTRNLISGVVVGRLFARFDLMGA